MTLLNPLALWFLLLLPLLIGLYFFREQSRPLQVPALFLWEEALGQSSSRRFFRRLRHFWLLLLAVLLLLLLTLSLSRPELREWLPHRQNLVLVVDNSLSMGRLAEPQGKRTLLDEAQARARAYVDRLPRDTHAAILQTSPAEVVSGFTIDSRILRRALERVRLSSVPGDPGAWRDAADLLVQSRPESTEIIFLTDRAQVTETAMPDSRVVQLQAPRLGNLGITAFQARSGFSDPSRGEIFTKVRNFSRDQVRASLSLTVDGEVLEVASLRLEPNEEQRVATSYQFNPNASLTAEGLARAELRLPEQFRDALPADNQAFTVLPSPERSRVLLVSRGNWFLESFLRADPLIEYEQLNPEVFTPQMASGFEVLIFDGTLPDIPLDEWPASVLLLEAAPPNWITGQPAEGVAQLAVAGRAEGWPGLELLDGATVRNILPLDPEVEVPGYTARPLVQTVEGQTAVLLGAAEDAAAQAAPRWAAVGFDLRESNLPLQVKFPVMMRELLFWLSGRRAEVSRLGEQVALGATIRLSGGARVARYQQDSGARLMGGQAPAQPPADGIFRAEQAGFYEIVDGEEQGFWLAVSALDAGESGFGFDPLEEPEEAVTATHGTEGQAPAALVQAQPPWVILAVVALILLVLEWLFFSRFRLQPQPESQSQPQGGAGP